MTIAEMKATLAAFSPLFAEAKIGGGEDLFPTDIGQAGPDKSSEKRSSDDLRKAVPLRMDIRPSSIAGKELIRRLAQLALEREQQQAIRKNARGTASRAKLEGAIGALVGAALLASCRPGSPPVMVRLVREAYTGEVVSYRVIKPALFALEDLGLIHVARGFLDRARGKGRNTRIWPTRKLLALAAEEGIEIEPAAIKRHFAPSKVLMAQASPPEIPHPVILQGLSSRPKANDARAIPFDPDAPEPAALRADVQAHNALAAITPISGCRAPRWCRKFKLDWTLHGRWYVPGADGYQTMSSDDRLQIRIGGEPVVEVDIQASLITLLHGVLGLPTPEDDPYTIPKVPRPVVKAWINATLGKGSPVRAWSEDTAEDEPGVLDHDPRAVGDLVMAKYPFLKEPWRAAADKEALGSTKRLLHHKLTGIEAAIMTAAMAELRGHGILALPMHDGLIVPASAETLACELIRAAGERVAGVELRLKVDRAP